MKTFILGKRCPAGQVRGLRKSSSPALTHRLRRSPLSQRVRVKPVRQDKFLRGKAALPVGEGSFRVVDSAPSPSASRRMTGVGDIL